MFKLTLAALAIILAGAQAQAADKLPFVGKWDCQVAQFTFTDTTYDAGEGPMPIRKVEKDGDNFMLSFDDDYSIGLSSVTDRSMSWFSPESGDGFDCTRLAD